MTEFKSCAACGAEKPLSAFTKRSGSAGRRGTCRSCLRKRKHRAEEPAMAEAAEYSPAQESPAKIRTVAASKGAAPGATAEPSAEAPINEAIITASAAADNESAVVSGAPRPKRKRRRRKGKSAEQRRQAALQEAQGDGDGPAADAPDSEEPSDPAGHSAAVGPEAGAERTETEAHGEQAQPRKRKRKRRRGRGKSSKRLADLEEVAESTGIRPPDRKILPVKGNFSYKTSLLNDRGRGMIRLRGRRETGKRWSTEIPTEMAIRMVEEGAAGIIHPGLIHKLYTKADFRVLVLQRDDYVCKYCGNFGDTIDHVMPKSKGGLSTPANCVCACADCNLKKADSLDYVDDEVLQHFHFQT